MLRIAAALVNRPVASGRLEDSPYENGTRFPM
jgi:hypothetical protein